MIDSTHTSRPAAAPNPPTAPNPLSTSTPLASPTPAAGHGAGPGTVPGTSPAAEGLSPYAAPAIIFRTPLEAVAASCYSAPGKADLISCLVGNS